MEASKLELAITLLFACAQKHAKRQISCLTIVLQVTACLFGLVPGKQGMVNARQDLRPTSTPGSRVGGSTLTGLGQSPHSCDNRNCLAAEAEALVKSFVLPTPQRRLLAAHIPSGCCCWCVYCGASQVCPPCPR